MYDNENVLTNAAIIIIYKDGEILKIPKKNNLNYHIEYINEEINNNYKLRLYLENCDIKGVLENPSDFLPIINELTLNGHIILINFACNYMGPTNYFAAYLPQKISDKQRETISYLELYIKELEFDHIGVYSNKLRRVKMQQTLDLLNFVKNNKTIRTLKKKTS